MLLDVFTKWVVRTLLDRALLAEIFAHSPSDVFRLAWSFLLTRLFYPGAKIVRRPIAIRGKKSITFGDGFSTGRNCRLETFGMGRIEFGSQCQIGDSTHIVSSDDVQIGDGCLIASKVFISDTSHGDYGISGSSPSDLPAERPLVSRKVKIGNNVWIGDNVSILPGASIGDGSVIGANAVVLSSIPENCVAVGVPARPIKFYDFKTGDWVQNEHAAK